MIAPLWLVFCKLERVAHANRLHGARTALSPHWLTASRGESPTWEMCPRDKRPTRPQLTAHSKCGKEQTFRRDGRKEGRQPLSPWPALLLLDRNPRSHSS